MILENRSMLFNVEPGGVNSPYIESLSSYIGRIAQLHCINTGTLLVKIINSLMEKEYIENIGKNGGDGFYKSSNSINGNGRLANDFVIAMEYLTKRNDLINNTLLKFDDILPSRGLLREKRAWCPICLEQMQSDDLVYEPLIWQLSLVIVCPKHYIYLEEVCPDCNSSLNVLARRYVPGYCSKCLNWLGKASKRTSNKLAKNDSDVRLACFVSDLLGWSIQNDISQYRRQNVSYSLRVIVAGAFDNNITKAASYFGFSKNTFSGWCKGYNRPTIKSIVDICLKLNINMGEFLNCNEGTMIIEVNPQIEGNECVKTPRKKYDKYGMKDLLDYIILNEVIISIKKIADIIGCDRRNIGRLFPQECSTIIANNKRNSQIKKKNRITNKYKEVESEFIKLCDFNIYPSYRKMEYQLGNSVFREKLLREKFENLKKVYLE